jgi:hypothetical protein
VVAAPEREARMRSRALLALVALLGLTVAIASLSSAAIEQYQFTGTVTGVDAKAKTISVDKDGQVWEFSTDGLKDLKVKKGNKVTVHYQMIAKKVEAK